MQRFRIPAILTALLLGAFVIWLLLQTAAGARWVEKRLRAQIHPELQINGSVKVGLLPRISMTATDLTIPSQYGPHPLVSVGQWRSTVAWLPLLRARVRLHAVELSGVNLYRERQQWQPLLSEVGEIAGLEGSDPGAQRSPHQPTRPIDWRKFAQYFVVRDFAVMSIESGLEQELLMHIQALDLNFGGSWPTWVGTRIHASLSQLSLRDASELGLGYAFVEQWGISADDRWDVRSMDMTWDVGRDLVRLTDGRVIGSWGALTLIDGSIAPATGELAVVVDAKLTNAPRLTSRGLSVQVRESALQFEILGHWRDPGVSWVRSGEVAR